VALGLAAALLCSLALQQPGGAGADEQRRLAEHLAALEAFTVRYSLFQGEEDAVEMRLAYAAPDRAALQVRRPGETMRGWVDAGVLVVLVEAQDGAVYGRVDVRAVLDEWRDVRAALSEAFGGPGDPGELRPIFHVHPADETAQGEPRFSFELGVAEREASFFCWYGSHGDAFEGPAPDGWHLVRRAAGEEKLLRIAREGPAEGFLELAFGKGQQGRVTLRLDGLELAADESAFEIAAAPGGADDISGALAAGRRSEVGEGGTRSLVFRRLQHVLEEGAVAWDHETRARASGVFAALHRHTLPARYEEWMGELRERARELAAHLERELEREDADREALAASAAAWREALAANLRQSEDGYAEHLAAPFEGPWTERLLDLERAAARRLYWETVATPVLSEVADRIDPLF